MTDILEIIQRHAGVLIPLVGLIAVIAFLAKARGGRRLRTATLRTWAEAHSLSVDPASRPAEAFLSEFECLENQGRNPLMSNVMTGLWNGRGIIAFDHSALPHSHRQGLRQQLSIVILTADTDLPPLLLEPTGPGFKEARRLCDEEEFFATGDSQFDKWVAVTTAEPDWARTVLSQEMMTFLLEDARYAIKPSIREFFSGHSRFVIEMSGQRILAHLGDLSSPEEFERAATVLDGVLARLPREGHVSPSTPSPGTESEARAALMKAGDPRAHLGSRMEISPGWLKEPMGERFGALCLGGNRDIVWVDQDPSTMRPTAVTSLCSWEDFQGIAKRGLFKKRAVLRALGGQSWTIRLDPRRSSANIPRLARIISFEMRQAGNP